MATNPKLLSLPLEIRYRIYFYLLPDAVDNINMVRDDMDGPLKTTTNLLRSCQHIYHELIQFYYSTKTFILDLTDPKYAPNRFINGTKSILKYIRRVRNLRLVIGDVYATSHDLCPISEYAREQLDWFLRALGQANEDHEGLWLRTMTVLDCCEIIISKEITKELLKGGEERRELLVRLLEPFNSRIGESPSIESRVQSRIRTYGDLPDTPIGTLAAHLYTWKMTNRRQGQFGTLWLV